MSVLMIMAQHSKSNNANTTTQEKPMFHDFLGMKPKDSPAVLGLTEASQSASASVGASSGGGRGPISTTSDLGSVERQVGSHLEGVPFYGPRSDISGPEVSNRLLGSKRSNSDSAFMGSSRDGIPQMGGHDSLESSHLMKILRKGPGGEQSRRSNDEEVFFGRQPLRPTSASFILQPPTGSRIDAHTSKWERPIPMSVSPTVQYHPRGSQFVPFMHQVSSNRLKDANAGPSVISQSAADEGSRTGIKGPGILSSINVGGGVSERNSSGVLPSSSRPKSGTLVSEPESLTPRRSGSTPAGRQMTIFYGGQAHVFDDVHPNKADVIMALAGSNGGSWSTTYSPKSTVRQINETHIPSGENEAGLATNMAITREFRGRLPVTGNSSHGLGSGDRISTPAAGALGGHQGIILAKEMRNPVQGAECSVDEKREL